MKLLLSIILTLTAITAYSQNNTFPTAGNVGIGTTSPTDLLQLNHGAARKGISLVGDGDGSAYTDITFKINNVSAIPNGATWAWTMSHRRDGYFSSSAFPGSSVEFYGLRKGGGYYAPLSFKSNGDLILVSPKNATSGNVGIGTTNPTSKLTIDGNINGWLISSKATVTAAGEYNGIKLLTGYPNDTNKWAAVVATAEDQHSNSTALAFYSTASEKMRIAGNGNVGIGTTSPQAKLAVKGNILAEQIKVTSNIAVPDYVFGPDYEMLSLSEVENYVRTHKHLPEIPSAKTIGEEGMDLGTMNLLLLKKVEELTLHLIEKDKVIDKQQDVLNEVLIRLGKLENK